MNDPTATKFPLADLSHDAKSATYIAVLERKVQYQETLLLQYRALLEALTGDQYEEIDTRMSTSGLKKTAATAFERNLARDFQEAERMVEANLASANSVEQGVLRRP
jgi:hypothetical protein